MTAWKKKKKKKKKSVYDVNPKRGMCVCAWACV